MNNSILHTSGMNTRLLLARLMEASKDNPHSLSRRLGGASKQPQIYKFIKGLTADPRRKTLEPVADFYGVSVEAFFNEAIASELLQQLESGRLHVGKRGLVAKADAWPPEVREPTPAWGAQAADQQWPFQTITPGQWGALSAEQKRQLEMQISGLLSALYRGDDRSITRRVA
jgi:hypothetical protein